MSNNFATDKHLPKIVLGSGQIDMKKFNTELQNSGNQSLRNKSKLMREVRVKRKKI
jgi:hypothetical protein